MSTDERLRELERRWKETGAVEDEAAWLKERVRAGELSHERLELAAYCGHGGSAEAVGSSGSNFMQLRQWLANAPHAKTIVLWRAALTAMALTEGECANRATEIGPSAAELAGLAANWLLTEPPSRFPPRELNPGLAYTLVGDAIHLVGEEALAERVRSELLSWALGSQDPVVARNSPG